MIMFLLTDTDVQKEKKVEVAGETTTGNDMLLLLISNKVTRVSGK